MRWAGAMAGLAAAVCATAALAQRDPLATFSLWSHYWKIKDSDVQPIGPGFVAWEPGNSTHETGIELRYRF